VKQLKKDNNKVLQDFQLALKSEGAWDRLLKYFKNEIEYIVKYPLYIKNVEQVEWKYNCQLDKEEIRHCATIGFFETVKKVCEQPELIHGKSIIEIHKVIQKMIRNHSTHMIYDVLNIPERPVIDKTGKKIYPRVCYLENSRTVEKRWSPENSMEKTLSRMFVEEIISNLLQEMDNIDREILCRHILYEIFEIKKDTIKKVADTCSVSEITVIRRKKKLLKKLQSLFIPLLKTA
jgi:hypothetical protein